MWVSAFIRSFIKVWQVKRSNNFLQLVFETSYFKTAPNRIFDYSRKSLIFPVSECIPDPNMHISNESSSFSWEIVRGRFLIFCLWTILRGLQNDRNFCQKHYIGKFQIGGGAKKFVCFPWNFFGSRVRVYVFPKNFWLPHP